MSELVRQAAFRRPGQARVPGRDFRCPGNVGLQETRLDQGPIAEGPRPREPRSRHGGWLRRRSLPCREIRLCIIFISQSEPAH